MTARNDFHLRTSITCTALLLLYDTYDICWTRPACKYFCVLFLGFGVSSRCITRSTHHVSPYETLPLCAELDIPKFWVTSLASELCSLGRI